MHILANTTKTNPAIRPATAFAILAAIFGSLIAISTPPFQSPDELAHFLRIWQISRGTLVANEYGGAVPVSILEFSNKFDFLPLHPDRKVHARIIFNEFRRPLNIQHLTNIRFANTAIYSPVPYLFQAAAVRLVTLAGGSPAALLYFGRLSNLLAYVILGYCSINIMPVLKWTTCILLLNPISLFLAGSLSADPTTLAIIFILTAYIIKFTCIDELIDRGANLCFAFVIVCSALVKWAYFPISFLVFLIPHKRNGDSFLRRFTPWAGLLFGLMAIILWAKLSRPAQVPLRAADPKLQIEWIIHHPLKYIAVIIRTIRTTWLTLAVTFVGDLGWLDTLLSPVFDLAYVIGILWVTLNDDQPQIKIRHRLAFAMMALLSAGIIITCEYAVWNAVGFPIVEGLQGRYFLPLAILVCTSLRRTFPLRIPPLFTTTILFTGCSYTLWVIICRYYIIY